MEEKPEQGWSKGKTEHILAASRLVSNVLTALRRIEPPVDEIAFSNRLTAYIQPSDFNRLESLVQEKAGEQGLFFSAFYAPDQNYIETHTVLDWILDLARQLERPPWTAPIDKEGTKRSEGKVISVGKGKSYDEGKVFSPDRDVDDNVLFARHSGSEIRLEGMLGVEISDLESATEGVTVDVDGDLTELKSGIKSARHAQASPQKPSIEPPGDEIALSASFTRIMASAEIKVCNATLVSIFYATDRLKIHDWSDGPQYSSERSPRGVLEFGECTISIPKVHKVGRLESPSFLKLELRPNPEKHIILAQTMSLDEKVFLEHLQLSVAKSDKREVFVFVHGYNVTFEDAARRTGQIAFDLNFLGAAMLYSWPSNGRTADYTRDEANIIWSAPHFRRFMVLISKHSGAERIHVIAHSMGNRAVCDALNFLSNDSANELKLSHLVLAAPDIDADTFTELAGALQKISARITVYESSNDKALRASKAIHGNPRAGEPVMVVPGIETIDASRVDSDFLGHSYFGDTWPLLSDIYTLLSEDKFPDRRFGLELVQSEVYGPYYAFRR